MRFLADESCDAAIVRALRDFGQLVFAGVPSTGVMLIRFPPNARSRLADTVLEVIGLRGEELLTALASVSPAGVRILRLR